MQVLQSYHWPGNVRELRNVVESMLVLERGKYLDAGRCSEVPERYRPAGEDRNLPVPWGKSVEQAERELILRALLDIKGNIVELKNLLQKPAPAWSPPEASGASRRSRERRTTPGRFRCRRWSSKMIAEALERYKGNRRVAARALNISERTLYRKIKEYGLG